MGHSHARQEKPSRLNDEVHRDPKGGTGTETPHKLGPRPNCNLTRPSQYAESWTEEKRCFGFKLRQQVLCEKVAHAKMEGACHSSCSEGTLSAQTHTHTTHTHTHKHTHAHTETHTHTNTHTHTRTQSARVRARLSLTCMAFPDIAFL